VGRTDGGERAVRAGDLCALDVGQVGREPPQAEPGQEAAIFDIDTGVARGHSERQGEGAVEGLEGEVKGHPELPTREVGE